MEERASLTVTQDMDSDFPDHAISIEQQLKQRVLPRGETSRMGEQAMEREDRAVTRASKKKDPRMWSSHAIELESR